MGTFVDLFAGIGGFRYGLEANGFSSVYGADFNKHAALTYAANFDEDIYRDITQINPNVIPDFDILCGGFPCQPFSRAGLGLGFEDTRGTLFWDICRIIDAKKPRIVFLENVKNLTYHDGGKTFQTIRKSLEDLGYTVSTRVLNANTFGVPQSRERIIIVGVRNGKKNKSDGVYDFDLVKTITPVPDIKSILCEPTVEGLDWLDEDKYVLLDDELVKTSPNTGLRFAGYLKATLRAGVDPLKVQFSRAHRQPNRIYDDSGTHPTLSAQEKSGKYFVVTDNRDGDRRVRKLQIGECYKLFGFPDSHKRVGALGEQYARIGNSICVPMVTAVSEQFKGLL